MRGNGPRQQPQFVLQIRTSEYSKQYAHYMRVEWHQVEPLIRSIVQKPFCREYYLKYPLEALLKATAKKMMLNMYEAMLYGYFLSQVKWELEWDLDEQLSEDIQAVFPNILHVNEPTNPGVLKRLSIFLYLSAFSVKEFLNEDVSLIQGEMVKLLAEFELILGYWTSTQPTVNQVLHPRILNSFYRTIGSMNSLADYNVCVDRVLQISPCYNISTQNEKPKDVANFGFMEQGRGGQEEEHRLLGAIKMEDNLDDYQFDGDI